MDPRERLRLALLGAGCSRCGRPYAADGIRVLAQREEIAFVQLVCSSCDSQTLALVTGFVEASEEDELGAGRRGTEREADHGRLDFLTGPDAPPEPDAPPLSEADVLEATRFLAAYDGDLRSLFRRGDRGLGGR